MSTEHEHAKFRENPFLWVLKRQIKDHRSIERKHMKEEERDEFEEWAKDHYVLQRSAYNDTYISVPTMRAWDVWQARAALQSQDKEDAERYRALVESGRFVPSSLSPSCLWGLRTSGSKATKAELDSAIDHARRAEGGGE